MQDQGHPVDRATIDLDARNNADFENFYQDQLGERDYGAEHPRVLLEMMAEYGAHGLGAAGTYGSDLQHAGRLSFTDASGQPVRFIGQDMLDMMAESIQGTHLLKLSLTNDGRDDVWAYGYENDDRFVLFLSADDQPPGSVMLDIDGLGDRFQAVWGDKLTASVPQDWMARFGIPDVAGVDESAEGQTFAMGLRSGVQPVQTAEGLSVQMDQPHEVLRLSFAKTALGAAQISAFSRGEAVVLDDQLTGEEIDLESRIAGYLSATDGAAGGDLLLNLRQAEHGQDFDTTPQDQQDASPRDIQADTQDEADHHSDAGFGDGAELALAGLALLAMPFLGLAGI